MQSELDNYRRQIDASLKIFFESGRAEAGFKTSGIEGVALEILKEFSLRPGKRIRGALTLFMYEQLAGKSSNKIIDAAIAQELIQSYLLIIDDVMDRSATRRGKPAVHELLAAELGSKNKHQADMLAINIGLLSQHLASLLITKIPEEPALINKAIMVLHGNLMATVYGQMDDMINDLNNKSTEQEIIRTLERKVSYYSFIAPLQLGAALAGKTDAEAMGELEAIGRPAGIAFQLQDDVLGLFGNPNQTGKSASDDLKEGKFTLLMLYTLERADKDDAAFVRNALGNGNLSVADLEKVRNIVTKTGARKAVEGKAQWFSDRAKLAINTASILDDSAKSFLSDLIDYVTHRKK